jgi:hypothetical protein
MANSRVGDALTTKATMQPSLLDQMTPRSTLRGGGRPSSTAASAGVRATDFAPGAADNTSRVLVSSRTGDRTSVRGEKASSTSNAKDAGWKTVQDLFGAAIPDAIAVTNKAARSGNSKNFALINPLSGNAAHFINHAGKTRQTPVGTLSRVEVVHYNLLGGGTRREDGGGISKPFEFKGVKGTFFFNTRVGDTNAHHAINGISANMGAFFPLSQARVLVDKMPNGGKSAAFKKTLEGAIAAAKATDTQVGFAYRGTLEYNAKTKQTVLNVSGSKIPLSSLIKPNVGGVKKPVESVNSGNKGIARANNEEAYTNGANPFELADQTRAKTGHYLNHGDRVADIAADVRQWQNRLEGTGAKPVRSNADAARVLESGIARFESVTPVAGNEQKQVAGRQDTRDRSKALSAGEREQLINTLLKLERQGQYFGSYRVQTAARDAQFKFGNSKFYPGNAPATKTVPETAREAAFTREVFQGKFRKDAVHQYNFGDGVRDAAVFGLNRFVAAAATVFEASPVSDGTLPVARMTRESKGFALRMASQGSTLQQLGLSAKGSKVDAATDARATEALNAIMLRRLMLAEKPVSAQARYAAFQALTLTERSAVAVQVQSILNRR